MRLCRFNMDRLGLIVDQVVLDVTSALADLPLVRWSRPASDPVISALEKLKPAIIEAAETADRMPLSTVRLDAPVVMPSKIIGAPVNYHAHMAEAQEDRALHQGRTVHPIDEIGCFLKASSSLVGPDADIEVPTDAERVDYEGEVAVIIGKAAKNVPADEASDYVAGYSLALDMSVRGKQDRSMRKSCDGFSVLGPALVTSCEITNPSAIPFELLVNGEQRQKADTSLLIRSVPELIEMCSQFYTLYPGDVIMTGTPAGVGPVVSGDQIEVISSELGRLTARIQ